MWFVSNTPTMSSDEDVDPSSLGLGTVTNEFELELSQLHSCADEAVSTIRARALHIQNKLVKGGYVSMDGFKRDLENFKRSYTDTTANIASPFPSSAPPPLKPPAQIKFTGKRSGVFSSRVSKQQADASPPIRKLGAKLGHRQRRAVVSNQVAPPVHVASKSASSCSVMQSIEYLLNENGMEQEGIDMLRMEVGMGREAAVLRLAKLYHVGGYGIAKDLEQASALYSKCSGGEALAGLGSCMLAMGKDYHQAVNLLRRAATEFGNTAAMTDLAQCYGNGVGVDHKDVLESVRWYQCAAQDGNPLAMFRLGSLLLDEDGPLPVDSSRARLWIERAEKFGSADAALSLAFSFRHAKFTPKDLRRSEKYLERAATLGCAEACYELGVQNKRKSARKGLEWFEKGGRLGHRRCLREAGVLASRGAGNKKLALTHWRAAATLGCELAMGDIGFAYSRGEGVPRDEKEAFMWFTRAAENGNSRALEHLGECYHRGYGVDVDYVKSFNYYLAATQAGNTRAYYSLAHCYQYGRGTEEDLTKACETFQLGYEAGDTRCLIKLGTTYHRAMQYEVGTQWLEKAALSNDARGAKYYADAISKGVGIRKDPIKAKHWYARAAELGCKDIGTGIGEPAMHGLF